MVCPPSGALLHPISVLDAVNFIVDINSVCFYASHIDLLLHFSPSNWFTILPYLQFCFISLGLDKRVPDRFALPSEPYFTYFVLSSLQYLSYLLITWRQCNYLNDTHHRVDLSVGPVNCCWPSRAQTFLVLGHAGLVTVFFRLTTLGVVRFLLGVESSFRSL